jgi:hypothetical protein
MGLKLQLQAAGKVGLEDAPFDAFRVVMPCVPMTTVLAPLHSSLGC